MRAVRYHTIGEGCDLRLEEVPVPQPSSGEVLVRVHWSSLNPVDWKIAAGQFRLLVRGGRPRTMGCDFAGEVAATGTGVTGLRAGDRVWGFVDPFARAAGAFADYCAVPAAAVFPLPAALPFREAAALACVGATSVRLCELGNVREGRRVLVNGASGGVGHVAVQVARARGAAVTAVGSAARREFLLSLGAESFLDYRAAAPCDWPGGFDAVFDCVPNLPRRSHRHLLAHGGHYVSTLPGPATFVLDPVLNRLGPIRRHGVMLAPDGRAMREIADAWTGGRLRCHVEREYTLDEVPQAVERSRTGRVQGKLVIRVA